MRHSGIEFRTWVQNLSSESAINYTTIVSAMQIKRALGRNLRRKTSKLSSTRRHPAIDTKYFRFLIPQVRSSPRIYPLVFRSDIFPTLFLRQRCRHHKSWERQSVSPFEESSYSFPIRTTTLPPLLPFLRGIKNRWGKARIQWGWTRRRDGCWSRGATRTERWACTNCRDKGREDEGDRGGGRKCI